MPNRKPVILLSFAGLVLGCTVDSDDAIDASSTTVDASTLAPDSGTAVCDPTAAFATPVLVGGLSTTTSAEQTIRLAPDELTAYLSGQFDGATQWDLAVTARASTSDPFGAPTILSVSGATSNEFDPSISADGLTLLFGSDRGGAGADLFVSTRATTLAEFGTPAPVAGVNSTDNDGQPFLTIDGQELWLNSTRAGGAGGNDIYRATRTGGAFGSPTLVAELSSPLEDWLPTLSADGLTMYISSNRATSEGYDIWTSHRTSTTEAWPAPTRVAELATTANDHPGWLSADNCRFYYFSAIAGSDDVYLAVRTP